MNQLLPYWRNETSGVLAPVVEKYMLTRDDLTEDEKTVFASYLQIWADWRWAASTPEVEQALAILRNSVEEKVKSGDRQSITQWLSYANSLGIDPL